VRRRLEVLRELRHPNDWWLFLRVFAFAAAVPLMFRCKFSTTSRWLDRRASAGAAKAPDSAVVAKTIRCVEMARAFGSPLVRPTCLTRGVTHFFFLRRAGLPVSLCFGAATQDGKLVQANGHCWLVKDGEPFLENSDPRKQFLTIYSLPESVGHSKAPPTSA
jgi:hypothetical protein